MEVVRKLTWPLLLIVAIQIATPAHADSRTVSSSVGKDVVIDQPAKPATSPAQAMGRRAGQQQRQGIPPVGIQDPNLLPFCRPGNGVICADNDYTALLQVKPANIDLTDDNYAYAGVRPKATASIGTTTKINLGDDTVSTAAEIANAVELKSNIGTESLDVAAEATTTPLGAELKGRPELLLPEKLTVTVGKVESEGTVESRTNRPNFFYILGQNFGLPIGLSQAKDEVSGRR